MPEVKMQNRHCACAMPRGIQWYIEDKKPGRCLARAFLNVRVKDEEHWARAFDKWRMLEGNHLPYHGRPAVQYVHAQIAPDPKDNVTVEQMLDFAREWAAHWFGSDFEAGKLGCFQVAIGIHDDSENGIIHAHLVINNTDLLTGKRIQISKRDNRGAKDHAQDLAREREWHYFDYTKDHRWIEMEKGKPVEERLASLPMGTAPTIAERRMAERGKALWKDVIRDRVFASKAISRTEAEFLDACEQLEVGVAEREGDYVYSIEWESERKSAAGANLGRGWKGRGVEGRATLAKRMAPKDAEAFRRNVLKAFREARTWEVSATGLAEHEIASALMTMHRCRAWTPEGLERAIRKSAARISATRGREQQAARRSYAELLQAKETVEKADLVVGVDPHSDSSNRVGRPTGGTGGMLSVSDQDADARGLTQEQGRSAIRGR